MSSPGETAALSQPVVDAFLMRVRLELYTAAQRLDGEALAELHTLLHEVADLVDFRVAAAAREAAARSAT